jgi:hypothetical protein
VKHLQYNLNAKAMSIGRQGSNMKSDTSLK